MESIIAMLAGFVTLALAATFGAHPALAFTLAAAAGAAVAIPLHIANR